MTEDTGAPIHLEIEVDDVAPFLGHMKLGEVRAGYNLLRGPNGSGKSTLMRYMARFAASRMARGDLVIHDEAKGTEAWVQLGPARMTVRGTGEVPKRKGRHLLPGIEPLPEPVGLVMHGGHRKGEGPAYRERLRGLCRLLELSSDGGETVTELTEDGEVVSATHGERVPPDLVDVAEMVRGKVHELRRAEEKRAAAIRDRELLLEGQRVRHAKDVLVEGDAPDRWPDSDGREQDRLDEALVALEKSRTERAHGEAERERKDKAAATLESVAPPDVKGARDRVSQCKQAHLEAGNAERAEVGNVSRLEAELEAARERVSEAARRDEEAAEALSAAEKALIEAESAMANREELSALLQEPLEYPSRADVDVLEGAVELRRRELAIAIAAKCDEELAEQQRNLEAERNGIEERVAELEAEARAVWDRLADKLNRELSSSLVRVRGDDIEVNVDGEFFPVESDRVSEGQLADACYRLLIEHRDPGTMILIDGSTPLDGAHRKQLGDRLRETNMAIVAAAPSDDEEWRIDAY